MLGLIEKTQPEWFLGLLAGVRFSLLTFAVMSIIWLVLDAMEHRRAIILSLKGVPQTQLAPLHWLTYVVRLTIPLSVIFFTPGGLLRLNVNFNIPVDVLAWSQLAGLVCLNFYFILMQTAKLLQTGVEPAQAWRRTVPFVLAFLLLTGLGAGVYART